MVILLVVQFYEINDFTFMKTFWKSFLPTTVLIFFIIEIYLKF